MSENELKVAIDIGTSKVCVLVSRATDTGAEALGIADAPIDDSRGPGVQDDKVLSDCLQKAAEEAGRQAGVRVKRAYLGIGGANLKAFNTWDQTPRTNAVRVLTESDMSVALRMAAKKDVALDRQLIHIIPRRYTLDGVHTIRNPLGMRAGDFRIETHSITGNVHEIRNIERITRDAGIAPDAIIAEPLAAAEVALSDDEKEDGAILLDIGSGDIGITAFFEGAPLHTSVLPVGGFYFTSDISVSFGIPFDKAEQIKLNEGTCTPEASKTPREIVLHPTTMDEPITATRKDIGILLKERLQEMLKMITINLEKHIQSEIPLEKLVLVGGGSQMEGLASVTRYMLQYNILTPRDFKVDGLSNRFKTPAYAVVQGLALWGMKNLPPSEHVSDKSQSYRSEPVGVTSAQTSKRTGSFFSLRTLFGKKQN